MTKSSNRTVVTLMCVLALGVAGCQGPEAGPPAETIFVGENIVTMDPAQPTVEAVAVRGQTIAAAGAESDVMALRGDATRVVELGDRALLPGFIDAHGHFLSVGRSEQRLSLEPPPVGDVENIDDIVRKVQEWIEEQDIPPGDPVYGRGYDDSLLEEGRHPTRDDLDRASTEHPIVLTHVSGHLTAVNSMALEVSGISADTPDPEGGHIRRVGGSNEPNGVLEEEASGLIQTERPPETQERLDSLMRDAVDVHLSKGITTIQNGGTGAETIEAFRTAAARQPFRADVAAFRRFRESMVDDPGSVGYQETYQNGLRIAGVKFMLDGSPQGRTAWMTEPYDEGPPGAPADYTAYPRMERDLYLAGTNALIEAGVPFLAHANGDAAIDLMMDGVENAVTDLEEMPDHRSVIIHAQLMREDQVERAARLDAVPSFFAAHTFFWGDWHRRSFGEDRASHISPVGSSIEHGVHFTIHNDAPVVPPDMMRLVHIAVNRKTRSGYVLGPEQRATVRQAVNAVTLGAAYQYFEEDTKGSITVGKQADLVILGENPLTADPAELADIPVVETFSRGRSVFQR